MSFSELLRAARNALAALTMAGVACPLLAEDEPAVADVEVDEPVVEPIEVEVLLVDEPSPDPQPASTSSTAMARTPECERDDRAKAMLERLKAGPSLAAVINL